MGYSPLTEVWVETIFTKPCTAWSAAWQMPRLSVVRVGSPTVLLVAVVTHSTVTHGCGTPATLNEQPAISKVSELRNIGALSADTRVLADAGCTWPPCGHIITLAVVRKSPMLRSPSARRR